MDIRRILIIAFLISLSICAFATTQVKAIVSDVSVSPAGPITMDVGQTRVFTAMFEGGSGSMYYRWYLDSFEVESGSPVYSFSPASTGSYFISVEIDDTDYPIRSDDVSVTVNSALIAPSVICFFGID